MRALKMIEENVEKMKRCGANKRSDFECVMEETTKQHKAPKGIRSEIAQLSAERQELLGLGFFQLRCYFASGSG